MTNDITKALDNLIRNAQQFKLATRADRSNMRRYLNDVFEAGDSLSEAIEKGRDSFGCPYTMAVDLDVVSWDEDEDSEAYRALDEILQARKARQEAEEKALLSERARRAAATRKARRAERECCQSASA